MSLNSISTFYLHIQLIKIINYGMYEDNKDEVDDESTFSYNLQDYINKERKSSINMTISCKYNLNHAIINSIYLYDNKTSTSTQYEWLYDKNGNGYGSIVKDEFKKIISRSESIKNEKNDIIQITTTYANKKNKFLNNSSYTYDINNNYIEKITYSQTKKQNKTKRIIEYYSTEDINERTPPPPPKNAIKFYSLIEGDYPQGSERILVYSDLEELSKDEIKILRNEIYARHGYIFKSTELHNYFYVKPWYKPISNDVSSKLTEIEQKNIALIKQNFD